MPCWPPCLGCWEEAAARVVREGPGLKTFPCAAIRRALQVRRRDPTSKRVIAEECRYDTTGGQPLLSQPCQPGCLPVLCGSASKCAPLATLVAQTAVARSSPTPHRLPRWCAEDRDVSSAASPPTSPGAQQRNGSEVAEGLTGTTVFDSMFGYRCVPAWPPPPAHGLYCLSGVCLVCSPGRWPCAGLEPLHRQLPLPTSLSPTPAPPQLPPPPTAPRRLGTPLARTTRRWAVPQPPRPP